MRDKQFIRNLCYKMHESEDKVWVFVILLVHLMIIKVLVKIKVLEILKNLIQNIRSVCPRISSDDGVESL